jgi:hypothetical protein
MGPRLRGDDAKAVKSSDGWYEGALREATARIQDDAASEASRLKNYWVLP